MADFCPPFLFGILTHFQSTRVATMTTTNGVLATAEPDPTADRLRSSAQVIVLPEGTYTAAVRPSGQLPRVINGVAFPAAQLSSVPQPGTAPIRFLQKGELQPVAWVAAADEIVISVPPGPSPLMITNYLFGQDIQSCVDLEIKRLGGPKQAPPVGLRLFATIQQVGEQAFAAGEWAAAEDAPFWIEGLRVETSPGLGQLLQYRVPGASSGDGHWTPAPGSLGSGGGRPLSGIAFRLMPPLANSHRVVYSARFLRHGEMEAADGEPCRSPQPQDPLIAVRVAVIPR
jgi:hypothetical protein